MVRVVGALTCLLVLIYYYCRWWQEEKYGTFINRERQRLVNEDSSNKGWKVYHRIPHVQLVSRLLHISVCFIQLTEHLQNLLAQLMYAKYHSDIKRRSPSLDNMLVTSLNW